MRVLVTGSRKWWCAEAIAHAFDELKVPDGETVVVVHGGADGADTMADEEARRRGWDVEPHPVSGSEWWRLGPSAGPKRNARMVALGADTCLAFPLLDPGRRTGTEDCMDKARRARIPVRVYRPRTPIPK